MLSRVANSLYWAGRYIERCDHTARFVNINYFSSLDTPNNMSEKEKLVLESLLFLAGNDYEGEITEKEVLHHIGFDKENPLSILSTARLARTNAHGTRHLISSETWEAINKFYHFVNNYHVDTFVSTGLYDLTTKLNEACSTIREKIIRTLLHDEVWALLMLGIHLERAFQIIRLINTKLLDIKKIEESSGEHHDLTYEWATLLRCAEVYDMSKKFYRRTPNKSQTIEFLLLNAKNPKSLRSNVEKIFSYLNRIGGEREPEPGNIEFEVGKYLSELQYMTMEDIGEDPTDFILSTFDRLNQVGGKFEEDYLFF
ncbi:MAG TPA: alpha-E domain-containing protein [Saprospiraceae bacterium]|nr:alpha-E domain-containing protein [Saprospiraceae bacterium]